MRCKGLRKDGKRCYQETPHRYAEYCGIHARRPVDATKILMSEREKKK